MATRYDKPIPFGWYALEYSSELQAGDVIPLEYFGRDLVLFRTESGEPRVLDAFCPHLGAHLGHGGRVEGEGLRCPFHAWLWDGEGRCVGRGGETVEVFGLFERREAGVQLVHQFHGHRVEPFRTI